MRAPFDVARRPDQERIHCRNFANAVDSHANIVRLDNSFVASDAPAIVAFARSGLLKIATSKRSSTTAG